MKIRFSSVKIRLPGVTGDFPAVTARFPVVPTQFSAVAGDYVQGGFAKKVRPPRTLRRVRRVAAVQSFALFANRVKVTASWGTECGENLDHLDALKDADLLVLFARRMKLPENQMQAIRAHWEAGRPIVGIRTASHPFQKPDNDVFDRQILGGSHHSHWADEPVQVTNHPAQREHPVLRGVGPL